MPLAQAQALVNGLIIHAAEPHTDAAALERLAQWALKNYSPVVAADPPDGLVMDVTGAAHLHGGESNLLGGLIRALADQGIEARAAIAGSWGAAHAFARFGGRIRTALAPGEDSHALLALPVTALRLPTATVASLHVLGFVTIGELAAQPRAPLAHRFGQDLISRLDQAFGRANEPIEPVRLTDLTEVRRAFVEPIGAPETLARYTGKLTGQLCAALEAKNLGARQLDLLFTRVDNRIEAIRVRMARPVRDAKRLTRLLCDGLGTVDPGFGIERMRLTATEAEPLLARQLSTADETEPDLSGLIDTLVQRLGAEHVYRLAPVESDVPERAVQRVAPLAKARDGWPEPWPRPVRLLRMPEPITTVTQLPDYPPRLFIRQGQRQRVVAADGPERVFGEWWRRDAEAAAVRDYFRVELESGERLWIYRSGDGEDPATGSQRWFLHGVFG